MQSRFVVHLPVRVRYPRPGGGWSSPYDEQNGRPFAIPIAQEEALQDFAHLELGELRNYREAYTEADLERVTHTVREGMVAYIRRRAEEQNASQPGT